MTWYILRLADYNRWRSQEGRYVDYPLFREGLVYLVTKLDDPSEVMVRENALSPVTGRVPVQFLIEIKQEEILGYNQG